MTRLISLALLLFLVTSVPAADKPDTKAGGRSLANLIAVDPRLTSRT
jgi:hypothetical protein